MKKNIFLICALVAVVSQGSAQDTLRIMDAIRTALENNYSIIIMKNRGEVAANSNTVGMAGFLPTAAATAGYTENINNSQQKYYDGRERNGTNAKSTTLSAAATVDWTLFDGLAMFTNKAQLAEMEKMGANEARMMIENTISDVILNYYGLVQYERMAEVLQQAIELSMERKRLAGMKLGLGSGSELDLLQATVDMHADSSALIQQQNQIRSLRIELNKLMVRDVATPVAVVRDIPYTDTLSYTDLLAQTLEQSPQLLEARYMARISELDVRQARSVLYPQVGIFGGYAYSKSNSQTGIMAESKVYGFNYGVSATLNLFNGTKNLTNIRNAKIFAENSNLALKQVELNIRGEVFGLYDDYRTALVLLAFELDNVRLARENTRIAFEKYNLGAMSDVDLRTTQQKQLDAERRLLTAQFQAKSKEIQLRVVSGGLMKNLGF